MKRTFPVQPVHALKPVEPEARWLIEGLWGAEAVGIVGGEPKSCKSFLALSMAVSVASGRPCLGRFPVSRAGRVLLYAAEDSLPVVRERVGGIAAHMGVELSDLDLWLITANTVRLDVPEHRTILANTVTELDPVLLILDPFVRLHRIDENASADVVPLLAFLRELQRGHGCAVTIVHHARKGAGAMRAGQALRGSSEFHAWADSGLFLRRRGERLVLATEHRAHRSLEDLTLELETADNNVALAIIDDVEDPEPAPPAIPDRQRVINALGELNRPVTVRDLRAHCRMKTATVCDILAELKLEEQVISTANGWQLSNRRTLLPVSQYP